MRDQRRSRLTLRAVVRPLFRHSSVTVGVFLSSTVIVLLIVIAYLPKTETARGLGIGLAASAAASFFVAHLLESRDPCFRSRDEVERVLEIPVLASCPPPGDR